MFKFLNQIGTVEGGISLGLAALGLLVVSCSSSTVPSPSSEAVALSVREAGGSPSGRTSGSTLERQVFAGINAYRQSKGKAPLARHPGLDRIAREHAREMLGRGKMDHKGYHSRSFYAQSDHGLGNMAENVLWGRGLRDAGLAERMVQSWISSRGHRMNLLYDNEYTGIGVVRAADGSFYASQLSARPHKVKPLMPGMGPRTW